MTSAISPINIPGHLLELITDVVWSATLDGQQLLYANPALERVYGRPAADFYGNMGLWLAAVHPDDRTIAEESSRELLTHGHSEATYRIVRPDGEIRWLLDRKHVINDESGQPQYLGGIAADITTQKQTELALRESETQYRLLFEKSGDGILFTAAEGQILAANPAACEMFGRTEAEICRLGRAGLVDPTDSRLAAALQQRAQTGNVQGELNLLRADGSLFPTEITSSSYQNHLGHPRNSLIIRDISERKRLENELQISLEKYRVLFETFPLGITISDPDGQIIESNLAAERILGLPTAEQQQRDIDSPVWQIIRPDGSPLPAEEYASVRALREHRLVENMEMGVMKGAGEIAWISVTAAPLSVPGYGVAIAYIDITERKQAEATLRDSEEKYRALFNNELYAIAILDPETLRFLDMNEAFTRMYRYSRAELLAGMTAVQLVVDGDQLLTAFRQTSQDGTYFVPLRYHLKKDGSTFPVEVVGGPYTWQNRRVRFSIVHDISDRIKAEQALRESEARYRQIFEANSAIKLVIDPADSRIVDANRTACDFYGYDYNTLTALKITDINMLPPDEVQQEMERAKTLDRRYFNFPHRLASGEIRQVEVHSGPVEANGQTRLYSIIHDVTERKQAEAALRENEERLGMVITGANVGTWDWNIVTGEVTFNERWAEMLEYGLTEIESNVSTWRKLLHPDDVSAVMAVLNKHLAGQTAYYQTEHRLLAKSGQWKWILDTGKVLERDGQGQPIRAAGVHQDITERKQAQAERERLIGELQVSLAKVKQLSGMLPICSSCKKIRDDQGYWQQVEVYVRDHSEAEFSHGICPDCMQKLYPRDEYPFLYKDE